MKKRFLAVLMGMALMVNLVACGNSGGDNNGSSQSGTTTASAAGQEVSEEWAPDHDITIRVPKGAGDTMDTITRLVGQSFQEKYGANVIINNLTGANGAVAAADMMSYNPDPCEMMAGGIVLYTLAPLFSDDITMDLADWTFVCGLTSEDFVMVGNADKNLNTWDDVVAYAKENRLLVGTQASGGAIHMLATALCGEAGIDNWEAVTSDSSGKDILACSNGTVDIAIATTSACFQYIEEGTVVPILTFGTEDYEEYDGFTVTTATSLGYDLVWQSLNYIVTRSEVEDDIVAQMYTAISEYCATDEFLEAAEKAGIVPYICDGDTCYEMVSSVQAMCEEMYEKYYQ